MAERIADNVWRLEIPLEGNPLKTLNSYLITGERSLLIDTGFRWDCCREAMERQLTELGVDRNCMDILGTHLHTDHVGLVPELLRSGCRVYISTIDAPYIEDRMTEEDWRLLNETYILDGFSRWEVEHFWDDNPIYEPVPEAWDNAILLHDGDELRYGGYTLRCILTPGHTPGHLCLYEPERKWLFCGDHVLFQISPNICRWSGVEDSLGDYLESLSKICGLPVEQLFPAHRNESGSLRERAEELSAHHLKRIEDAFETVRDEPGLTGYDIAGRMRWKIRSRSWTDFPLEQKFFAVGEALAHLDYLEVRGRIERREENGVYRYYAITE